MHSPNTEEKNLLNAIRASRNVGLFAVDRSLRCKEWNEGMEQLTGKSSSSVIKKKLEEVFPGFHESQLGKKLCELYTPAPVSELSFKDYSFWEKNPCLYHFSIIVLHDDSRTEKNCIISIQKMEEPSEESDAILYNEYKTLAENTGIGIWKITRDGYTQYVNPTMCRILGIMNQEDLKGKTFHGFFTEKTLERMKIEHQKRALNIHSSYEAELVTPSGSVKNIIISGNPLLNEKGELEGMIATFMDITEKRKSEEHLIKSEERFRALFEKTGVASAISRNGILVLVNDAYVKLFGYNSAEDLIGSSGLNLIAPAERLAMSEKIAARYRGETVADFFELTGVKRDGSYFPIQVEVTFIDFPDGKATVIAVKDVSEQKRAESALIQSEAKFRGLFESNLVGIIFTNRLHEILEANNKFLEIIGYSREDLLQGLDWVRLTPEELLPRDFEAAKEALTLGFVSPYEKQFIRKDGSRVPVLMTATILKTPETGVGFIVDLTDLKKSKQETIKAMNELSTFLYMASHDLKGPLASVIGLTDVALREVNDTKALEYFKLIRECTLKLDKSLLNFLKIIRIKNNTVDVSEIIFSEMIEEIADSFRHYPGYEKTTLAKEINLERAFYSDPDLLKSILQNLIENSIKYQTRLNPSFIKISVREQGGRIFIEVTDNGRGIDEKIKDRVFDMFYRGDISSKGSGLGLYIVKSAVETLNGEIKVINLKEGGCKFTVQLPHINRAGV